VLCVVLAKKKELVSALKKASKSYGRLEEEEEQHKSQIASCETRDVRTRQVCTCVHVYLYMWVCMCAYVCVCACVDL